MTMQLKLKRKPTSETVKLRRPSSGFDTPGDAFGHGVWV